MSSSGRRRNHDEFLLDLDMLENPFVLFVFIAMLDRMNFMARDERAPLDRLHAGDSVTFGGAQPLFEIPRNN